MSRVFPQGLLIQGGGGVSGSSRGLMGLGIDLKQELRAQSSDVPAPGRVTGAGCCSSRRQELSTGFWVLGL